MLKSFIILFLAATVFACTNEIQIPSQANIYFPEKLLEQEDVFSFSLIKAIKEKGTLNYADCMQIAILYAKYDAKQENVYYWLLKSKELNSSKFCETLNFFEQNSSFDLNQKFASEIKSLLIKCSE